VLYPFVHGNLETFVTECMQRSANSEGYPLYVEQEFRDFVAVGSPTK
jgi:hypothetical protein